MHKKARALLLQHKPSALYCIHSLNTLLLARVINSVNLPTLLIQTIEQIGIGGGRVQAHS